MDSQKKKVLIIYPSLGFGGAQKIIAFVANSVCDEFDTTLLLLRKQKRTLDIKSQVHVIVEDVFANKSESGSNLLLRANTYIGLKNIISNTIKSANPKTILCFSLEIALIVCLIIRRQKISLLFSEREDPSNHTFKANLLIKFIYWRASFLIFQTNQARDYYGNRVLSKCTIIPNPAVPRILEDDAKANSYSPEIERDKYIFAAGRFEKRKGFDILIKAFSEVRKRHKSYVLKIYGDGEERTSLEKLTTDLCLNECVFIPEFQNDVMYSNINAQLFVLPSKSEGIPNVMIEAMLAGIPCVASDCSPGGARLLSDNGKYARLADNGDYISLANEINFCLDNKEQTEQMAREARISMQRFNPNLIADEWKHVIREH